MNIISRLIQWLESLDRKTVPATQATTTTEESSMSDTDTAAVADTTTDTTTAAVDVASSSTDATTTESESVSADVLGKLKTILVAAGHDVEGFFEEAVALAKKLAAKV